MSYKHVIWDWNGTLLDDVNLGHRLLNNFQELKGVKLSSLEEYRGMFTFPITDFYKKAGLFENMESFRKLADIYIKKYEAGLEKCSLQKDAKEVLEMMNGKGITNSILTASLETMAIKQLKNYEIEKYFLAVTGKRDHYASGKSELIKIHLEKIEYGPDEIVFVGDTLHDKDIAEQIGCSHIIVLNGHQDVEPLLDGKIITAKGLMEAAEMILK